MFKSLFLKRVVNVFIFKLLIVSTVCLGQSNDSDIRLPVIEGEDYKIENKIGTILTAHPIVVEQISKVNLFGRSVMFLPILLSDPNFPVDDIQMNLADPSKWWLENVEYSDSPPGRPSLVMMESNSSTLFGIAIDLGNSFEDGIGLGYIVVKRINEKEYEIVLEDYFGTSLFASRVEMTIIDNELGVGHFKAVDNQSETNDRYQPKWNIEPENFFMIRRN